MLRPCAIAPAIVAKLSSASTISAAFLATSVPAIPMAIPTSADFNDGASLTPSPVIATISPFFLHADTILTLCSGDTWANTRVLLIRAASICSSIRSISSPVTHSSLRSAMPSWRAIASAVSALSPVIMIVRTPARANCSTASAASGRTGSSIPAIPRNVSPLSSICAALGCMPIASTRSPAFVISASPRFACSLAAAENAAVLPLLHTYRHRSRISSGDPFVKEILPSNVSCSVVIRFRSESKAISSIRGMVSSNVSRCMPNAAAISKSANSVGSPRRSPPWRDASLQRENPCKKYRSPAGCSSFTACTLPFT